jgi:phosphopentomutase
MMNKASQESAVFLNLTESDSNLIHRVDLAHLPYTLVTSTDSLVKSNSVLNEMTQAIQMMKSS